MISKGGIGAWLQSLILSSGSSLSVEVLPEVVIWLLICLVVLLENNILTSHSRLESNLAMSLIHVIDIVLLLLAIDCLSIVLILKYFGEDSLVSSDWQSILIIVACIDAHSSSMDSIELVLHIIRCSRGPLTSSCVGVVLRLALGS